MSTLQGTFLALALNPEVVRKAHEELDAVVGRDRLPTFSDKPSLAYVNAIIAESFRYHNALPLGAPHRTINDDEFHGYFIPAGTIVQSNVWYVVPDSPSSRVVGLNRSTLCRACLHDPDVFPDPFEFRPERFIRDGKYDAGVRDPIDFVFGFGRRWAPLSLRISFAHLPLCVMLSCRICPGRFFALDTIFIAIASALHVFDVSPPLGDDGAPLRLEYENTDGILSCVVSPLIQSLVASLILGCLQLPSRLQMHS